MSREEEFESKAKELAEWFYETITGLPNLEMSLRIDKNNRANVFHDNLSKAVNCAIYYAQSMQKERRRAIDIAYEFRENRLKSFESKRKCNDELAFIENKIAEECRYIGNAISGQNALSVALHVPDYWVGVENELQKMILVS